MEEILVCRTGKIKKYLLSMRESMDRIVNKIKSIFHEKCGIDKLNVEELLGKEKWELYLFLIICLFWVQLFARPVRWVQAGIKMNTVTGLKPIWNLSKFYLSILKTRTIVLYTT